MYCEVKNKNFLLQVILSDGFSKWRTPQAIRIRVNELIFSDWKYGITEKPFIGPPTAHLSRTGGKAVKDLETVAVADSKTVFSCGTDFSSSHWDYHSFLLRKETLEEQCEKVYFIWTIHFSF